MQPRSSRRSAVFKTTPDPFFWRSGRAARPVPAKPSVWARFGWRPWSWAPALASLVLATVAAYQAWIVIPGLRGQLHAVLIPQAVSSHALPPLSRGDGRVLEVPSGSRFFTIYMDPVWQGSFANYLCSIEDTSGSVKFSVQVPAPAPGEPIQILMTRSLLPSGRYTVVIRNAPENGKPEAELARYSLTLTLD